MLKRNQWKILIDSSLSGTQPCHWPKNKLLPFFYSGHTLALVIPLEDALEEPNAVAEEFAVDRF